MPSEQIHAVAVSEFWLEAREYLDGRPCWAPCTAARKAERRLRANGGAKGGVPKVKYAAASIVAQNHDLPAAPLTGQLVRGAIAAGLRPAA